MEEVVAERVYKEDTDYMAEVEVAFYAAYKEVESFFYERGHCEAAVREHIRAWAHRHRDDDFGVGRDLSEPEDGPPNRVPDALDDVPDAD